MFRRSKDEKKTSVIVEKLYKEYKNLMYKEANNILKDTSLAEDAVQQSFIKIIKNIEKIDEKNEAKTRSFLVIICRNIALDIYKNRLYLNQNSNSLDFEIDEDDEGPVDYVEPSKIVIDKETIEKVTECIRNLPPIYRDVLLLEKVHNNTKEEIAELLNIKYETARKRSLRARKMIADALEKEDIK